MEAWLEAGVNRLSLGFQSLDADALGFLERAHSAEEAVSVFRQARAAGFDNISCDLIFAIPGLARTRWEEVLAAVLRLGPDHVSAYELTPEPGTRLGADVAAGRTLMPDDELRLEQYAVAERLLEAAGMTRYEISNWARPGRECRHNIAYWSGVPYAAAGAGAHAFVFAGAAPRWLRETRTAGAVTARQWNLANPAAYISAIRDHGHAQAGYEWLELATTIGDIMMMGLRMPSGVDLAAVSRRLGIDVETTLAPKLDELVAAGLLRRRGETVAATDRGMMLLNRVVAEFVGAGAVTPDAARPTAERLTRV
jgi:oxygen-independent coproporphyrinogen-3 oxidase